MFVTSSLYQPYHFLALAFVEVGLVTKGVNYR